MVRSVSFDFAIVKLLNEEFVPVLLNSFYCGGNPQWFYRKDFMDGMWRKVRGGNADWTVLTPDGQYLELSVKKGWDKWLALPEAQRRPGAVAVKEKPKGRPKGAPTGP